MPSRKTLTQHLATAHDVFREFLAPDAVLMHDQLLRTTTADPRQLLAATSVPAAAPPVKPPGPPPPADLPPTYFRLDRALAVVEVAPPLLALLELDTLADVLPDAWTAHLEPADIRGLLNQWLGATQKKDGFEYRFRFRTTSGRLLFLREQVWPLRDATTLGFVGWVGYIEAASKVIKITEPRRATSGAGETEVSA